MIIESVQYFDNWHQAVDTLAETKWSVIDIRFDWWCGRWKSLRFVAHEFNNDLHKCHQSQPLADQPNMQAFVHLSGFILETIYSIASVGTWVENFCYQPNVDIDIFYRRNNLFGRNSIVKWCPSHWKWSLLWTNEMSATCYIDATDINPD